MSNADRKREKKAQREAVVYPFILSLHYHLGDEAHQALG
jgi:hypothetical protein